MFRIQAFRVFKLFCVLLLFLVWVLLSCKASKMAGVESCVAAKDFDTKAQTGSLGAGSLPTDLVLARETLNHETPSDYFLHRQDNPYSRLMALERMGPSVNKRPRLSNPPPSLGLRFF